MKKALGTYQRGNPSKKKYFCVNKDGEAEMESVRAMYQEAVGQHTSLGVFLRRCVLQMHHFLITERPSAMHERKLLDHVKAGGAY